MLHTFKNSELFTYGEIFESMFGCDQATSDLFIVQFLMTKILYLWTKFNTSRIFFRCSVNLPSVFGVSLCSSQNFPQPESLLFPGADLESYQKLKQHCTSFATSFECLSFPQNIWNPPRVLRTPQGFSEIIRN